MLIDNQPIWATQQLYEEGRPGNKNKGIELMTEYGTVTNLLWKTSSLFLYEIQVNNMLLH